MSGGRIALKPCAPTPVYKVYKENVLRFCFHDTLLHGLTVAQPLFGLSLD